jgi:uncharacterized protein YoxC
MRSLLGYSSLVILAVTFLALPVYLIYLTFSSKKVDPIIKRETTSFNGNVKK